MPKKDFPEAAIPLLGTAPDHEIAKQFKLNRSAVFFKRKALNIPAFKKPSVVKPRLRLPAYQWSDMR